MGCGTAGVCNLIQNAGQDRHHFGFIQLEFIRKQQKSKNVYARHVDCKIF